MLHFPLWLNSPIFGGGIALMVSGFFLAMARNIPLKIFIWLKRQVTTTAVIANTDPCFYWLVAWLDSHPYTKKSPSLSVSTELRTGTGENLAHHYVFSPAPGNHFLAFRGKWIWLRRLRKDSVISNQSNSSLNFSEELVFTVMGRKQQFIRDIIAEAYLTIKNKQQMGASVYVNYEGGWSRLPSYEPRLFSSIVLAGTMAEDILTDIQEFLSSRDWYKVRGIPYRRGYMLTGPPGTGKTSLIMSISDELKMNMFFISLGSSTLNDDGLLNLMRTIPPGSIIIMEDVDAVSLNERDKAGTTEKLKRVSLSCLLNVLDGILAGSGNLIFMTSNHPHQLDSALVRPGRIDVRREFGCLVPEQARRLFIKFYPDADSETLERIASVVRDRKITAAQLQQSMLEHKLDAPSAARAFEYSMKGISSEDTAVGAHYLE